MLHSIKCCWKWWRFVTDSNFMNFFSFSSNIDSIRIQNCSLLLNIRTNLWCFITFFKVIEENQSIFTCFLFLFLTFILNQIFKWRPRKQAWGGKTTGKNIHIYSMSVKTWFLNANVERNMRASQGCICIFKENTGKKYRQNLIPISATLWKRTAKSPTSTHWKKNAKRRPKIRR